MNAERVPEQEPINNDTDVTADGPNIPRRPRTRQTRTQRVITQEVENTGDVDISTGENSLPVDELIDQVINSSKFRELFDPTFKSEERREHRFRRVLSRAANPQVQNRDSWNEVQGMVKYFIAGQSMEPWLNTEALGNLYLAERQALVRSTSSFLLGGGFNEEIAKQLEESRVKAVENLTDPEIRDLHLKFSQRIFADILLKKTK